VFLFATWLPIFVLFTLGFPCGTGIYMCRNRKRLHRIDVASKVGFFYAPFRHGAEFWEFHEILRKTLLTGVLLYVHDPTLRMTLATLTCTASICTLNYFEPHISKIVFWVCQLVYWNLFCNYVSYFLLSTDSTVLVNDIIARILVGCTILCAVVAAAGAFYTIVAKLKQLNKFHGELQKLGKDSPIRKFFVLLGQRIGTGSKSKKYHEACDLMLEYWGGRISGKFLKKGLENIASAEEMNLLKDLLVDNSEPEIESTILSAKERASYREAVKAKLVLQKGDIFKHFNDNEITAILAATEFTYHKAGKLIYMTGDIQRHLSIVVSGEVAAMATDGFGKLLPVMTVDAFGYFGKPSLISNDNKYDVSFFAGTKNVILMELASAQFKDLIESSIISNESYDALIRKRRSSLFKTKVKKARLDSVITANGTSAVEAPSKSANIVPIPPSSGRSENHNESPARSEIRMGSKAGEQPLPNETPF